MSGCAHRPSRPSTPRASVSEAHSREASRSRRGRSSRPISVANVCSAGPPDARRRRSVSRSASADGRRGSAAACTTASTQPSTSASAVSSRASAAFCSGVSSGWNMPCWSAVLQLLGILRVELADHVLQLGGVDLDPARVPLDRAEQMRAQPRHVGEEPLVGGLAQGEIQPHLLLRHAQVLAERRRCSPAAARPCRPGRAAGRCRSSRRPRPPARPRPARSACRTSRRPWSASCRSAGPPWPASPRAAHRPWPCRRARRPGRPAPSTRAGSPRPTPRGSTPRRSPRRTAATSRRPATGRPAARPPRPRCARPGRRSRPWCRPAVPWDDRLAGDLLGHVPVHRAALVREHLAELLEGGAQVVAGSASRTWRRADCPRRDRRARHRDRRNRTGPGRGPDHLRSGWSFFLPSSPSSGSSGGRPNPNGVSLTGFLGSVGSASFGLAGRRYGCPTTPPST